MKMSSHGGHSANVKMKLVLHADSIPVAQMGPDFLLVDSAADHRPGEASLVLQVDQSERCWKVNLPYGISAHSRRVTIADGE